ncbi:uncharacterized protein LOC118159527 [Oxyura jamaicensis]|uniref:uncharacterized protein LOC118159527 n=1 Tax=Oxyura jamaicensis TaxID=8884 RepID=UPI0015A67069|nr:uncharacterized protein LOC118159527 [Oxyura jamaicensis]
MMQYFLAQLLSFLQLLPLAVSSADPLPVPVLSTDPSYDVYYEGERVAFICVAPTKNVDGFRFFNQSGDQVYALASYSHTIAWFQLTAAKASAMEYTCMYWVKDAGRKIPSNRSLPLSIKVQGAPVAPLLSLDPQQPVYRYGNNVKLLCTVPFSSYYIREFQYYGDFGLAISIPVVKLQNYSYNLKITGTEVSGSYSCAYFVFKSGRAVRSESSPWVNVYVKRQIIGWVREILVGGSFFTINGLIFFFSHRLKKKRDLEEGFRMD